MTATICQLVAGPRPLVLGSIAAIFKFAEFATLFCFASFLPKKMQKKDAWSGAASFFFASFKKDVHLLKKDVHLFGKRCTSFPEKMHFFFDFDTPQLFAMVGPRQRR